MNAQRILAATLSLALTVAGCNDEPSKPGIPDSVIGTDTDTDAGGDDGGADTPVSPDAPGAGDVVITELMKDTSAVPDDDGEWFELENVSGTEVDLQGCTLTSDNDDPHTIQTSLTIPAGGRIVVARNADSAQNGGVTPDYAQTEIKLSNGGDFLTLTCGATEIDSVAWDDTNWPNTSGASISLDPAFATAADNDDPAHWCHAVESFGDGDLGTPGQPNAPCADLCDGVVCDTPPADDCAGNSVQVYGAAGTCNPVDGSCDYPVESTTDCGADTCVDGVCESDVEPQPGPGELVITEIMYAPQAATGDGEWFELFNPTATAFNLIGCSWEDDGGNVEDIDQSVVVPAGAYIVLAQRATASENGGLPEVAYEYGGNPGLGGADAITLTCTGGVVDAVDYNDFAAVPDGAALSLDPGSLNATDNDDGASWCAAVDGYGDGDLGTPGAANPACGEVDLCDGVVCDAPPADDCAGNSVQVYAAAGTCDPGDGSCDYPIESTTDCGADTCVAGVCEVAGDPHPGPGDVIVTEIFYDASGEDDDKEWIELKNVGSATFDLNGCTLSDGEDTVPIDAGGPLTVAPGGTLVLGMNDDTDANGGAPVDWAYGLTLQLANGGDQVILDCGGLVDMVDYAVSGFPDESGGSIALDPGYQTDALNDFGGYWCASAATFGDGDLGTPGGDNASCGDIPPCDDPPAPDCSLGAVQTWAAAGNWSGERCVYAVESSSACTGGQICEAGACIDAGDAAFALMDVALAGDLVITEIMKNPSGVDDDQGEWFEVVNLAGGDVELSGCTITTDDGVHTIAPDGSLVVLDGATAVFGINRDVYSNGGLAGVAYEYDLGLTNGDDMVSIDCDGSLVDAVVYTDADFPDTSGVAMQMDEALLFGAQTSDASTLAGLNDDGEAWCDAVDTYGTEGNLGTPGADANATCP